MYPVWHLLSAYDVPDSMVRSRDTTVDKRPILPLPLYSSKREPYQGVITLEGYAYYKYTQTQIY